MPPSHADAIALLYRDHHRWLQDWLRRRLASMADAADLAQDTFVRLLARPHAEGDALREPRAFLATVAHGLVVDHVRRRALERAYLEAVAQLPAASAPSPEQRALLLERLVQIDTLLEGLAPRARAAFLLSRLEGLTYPQIAAQLQVSLSTVEKHMAQALRHCMALQAAQGALAW